MKVAIVYYTMERTVSRYAIYPGIWSLDNAFRARNSSRVSFSRFIGTPYSFS